MRAVQRSNETRLQWSETFKPVKLDPLELLDRKFGRILAG
jgi:hypothetical protein